MKHIKTAFVLAAAILLSATSLTLAEQAKVYKATGNFLRIHGDTFLLRTRYQDIEITRDAKTKVNGTITTGVAATVVYDKVAGVPHAIEIMVTPGSHTTVVN